MSARGLLKVIATDRGALRSRGLDVAVHAHEHSGAAPISVTTAGGIPAACDRSRTGCPGMGNRKERRLVASSSCEPRFLASNHGHLVRPLVIRLVTARKA